MQGVKITRFISIFTSKRVWNVLKKIQLTKCDLTKTQGGKCPVPCLTGLNGLSKWSLLELSKRTLHISSPKRSPNEVSKFRTGSSLLGACWKIVGSLIYGILGIISFLSSSLNGSPKNSPNELSKWLSVWALQMNSRNELSKLRPDWSALGVCWEAAGRILEVRCLLY